MKISSDIRRAPAARLFVFLTAAVLLCAAAIPARAQTAARPQKIGVVDVDKIMQRSTSFQGAARRIESELQPLRDQYSSKITQRDALRDTLRDKRSALRSEEIAQQEEKYVTIADEINDLNYKLEKESGRLQREILEPVMKRLKTVIEEIARRDGYDLVLYANQLFFFSEQVDLTPQIMASLDGGAPRPALPSSAASKSSSSEESGSTKKSSRSLLRRSRD